MNALAQKLAEIPHSRWRCSAAKAAAVALPRKLEKACEALGLEHRKDMAGHRLMLKMSKPRKPTVNNPSIWHCKKKDLKRLMLYCDRDLLAETDLFLSTPDLTPDEQELWELDQKVNFRGFASDRKMVRQVLKMVATETRNLNLETEHLTKGQIKSTNQREALKTWLADHGCTLPDMKADTIKNALETGMVASRACRRLLRIRQAVSKTSTAKYKIFAASASPVDDRVRDTLLFHGASTGRWSGQRLQPHNFPQGRFLEDQPTAAEFIRQGDLELVRLLYGDPMSAFAAALRAVIVAPKNKEFFAGDFNAIEARVLFWLAGHKRGLQMFRDDEDLYRDQAMSIYSVSLLNVEDYMREVGKRAILGCGFGMGDKKFFDTCKQYGMEVSKEVAKKAVKAYRTKHAPVAKMWGNIERAAISAVQKPGLVFEINKTKWFVKKKYLFCELPSGRRLAYYGPEVRYKRTPWGEKRPALYHWGVHPKTKNWYFSATYGGKLTENVVQATARDFMACGMKRTEKVGYENILQVHDEIISERKIGEGNLKEFENLMAELPAWGKGAPVKVKGWVGGRYRK